MTLLDEVIARAFDLARLQAEFGAQVRGYLTDLFSNIADEVIKGLSGTRANKSKPARVQYSRQLLKQVNSLVTKGYSEMGGSLSSDLVEVAKAESEWASNVIMDDIAAASGPAVNEDDLRVLVEDSWVAGSPMEGWWNQQSVDTRQKLSAVIGQGVLKGESPDEIARKIRGEPTGARVSYRTKAGRLRYAVEFKGGILGVQTRAAQAVARTAVATIAANSRRYTYLSQPNYIKGLRQLSTLDDRTTKTCIAYDNEAWLFEAEDYEAVGLPVPERLGGKAQPQGAPAGDRNVLKGQVYYHGTSADFKEFQTGVYLSREKLYPGDIGAWFTESRETAQEFAGPNGRVIEAELTMRNPKVYRTYDDFIDDTSRWKIGINFQKKLIKEGYDGIIIAETQSDSGIWRQDVVVFDKAQIEAIGQESQASPGSKGRVQRQDSVSGDYWPDRLRDKRTGQVDIPDDAFDARLWTGGKSIDGVYIPQDRGYHRELGIEDATYTRGQGYKKAIDSVRDILKVANGEGYEVGMMFDAEGRLVWAGSGDEDSVDPYFEDDYNIGNKEPLYFVHNHPGENIAVLSVGDVVWAINNNLAGMYGYADGYLFGIEAPEESKGPVNRWIGGNSKSKLAQDAEEYGIWYAVEESLENIEWSDLNGKRYEKKMWSELTKLAKAFGWNLVRRKL